MLDKLNNHFLKHIDDKSIELVELLKVKIEDTTPVMEPSGSFAEKIVPDFSDKIDSKSPIITSLVDYNGRKKQLWLLRSDEKIGFGEEDYIKFKKEIESFYKSQEIKSLVKIEFVESTVFKWLVQTKEDGKAIKNLSSFLVEEIKNSCISQIYSFPILNLEIEFPIVIGEVELTYFTKKDFDMLSDNFVEKVWNEKENDIELIRGKYQGKVIVRCTEFGEPEKGKEKAINRCELAIDVLKICSDTLDLPDFRLDFDIDTRARYQKHTECYSYTSKTTLSDFTISPKFLPQNHHIDNQYFERVKHRGIEIFSDFLIKKDKKDDELSELITNGIVNFSKSLSIVDIHKRTAELFSVFESLLLPRESSPILDSLKNYGTKLISKEVKDRTELKKLFTEMYSVRSAIVHHGKRKKFDIKQLGKLQVALLFLLLNLIELSDKHTTKSSILIKIDEAMNSAF